MVINSARLVNHVLENLLFSTLGVIKHSSYGDLDISIFGVHGHLGIASYEVHEQVLQKSDKFGAMQSRYCSTC